LRLGKEDAPGNLLGRTIYPSPDFMSIVLSGQVEVPEFSQEFPARRIETRGAWSDLVLEAATMRQVQEVAQWIAHERHIMDGLGMRKKFRPGYRALFYGPPGTGKTFTCALLGKSAGLPVYRVDLSMVVSKYIGETEKNLASVFNHAEKHRWILFFDEADALFGKRTAVSDARDRFANQEVSYLLQKVEEYDGVVVLATNFKGNIDTAFMRRFENIVHFPMPSPREREQIWRATLPSKLPLEAGLDLPKIAEKYDLSGASIVDAVRAAVLLSVAAGRTELAKADLMEGIRREYYKFGRVCE
jgi:SpoVK/Ycf46/Vps4 family AAA+-type ATPase